MIGQAQGMELVREERNWTNPRVRFRRINGRIVPIVNKKRVGGDLNNIGNKAVKVGGVAIAAGLVARPISKVASKFTSTKPVGILKAGFNKAAQLSKPSPRKVNFAFKSVGFAVNLTTAGVMKAARNPIKLGIGLAALGFGAKAVGTELEIDSPLGKDIGARSE